MTDPKEKEVVITFDLGNDTSVLVAGSEVNETEKPVGPKVTELAQKLEEDLRNHMGTQKVEVIVHFAASPGCVWYKGRLYCT